MFLIVGLAAASIVLFLFFFIKRRRRTRRLEYDHAVASTLAAAGYGRTLLDGDDDDHRPMTQRRGSNVSGFGTMNSANIAPYTDEPSVMAAAAGLNARERDFDPYAPYAGQPPPNARSDGYQPARTTSPPLQHTHSSSTGSGQGIGITRESAASMEPLLVGGTPASMPTTPSTLEMMNQPMLISPAIPPIPPKSPRRPPPTPSDDGTTGRNKATRDSASSMYSNDDELDDQLVDLIPRPLEVTSPATWFSVA